MLDDFDSTVRDWIEQHLNSNSRLETTLLDVKSELYQLNDLRKRRDFIVDAIAMANTVRRIGRRGYIICGIDEKTRRIIDQSKSSVYPNDQDVSLDKLMDINERHLLDCLHAHVTPKIEVSLHYGEVQGPENIEAFGSALDENGFEGQVQRNRGIVVWLEFLRVLKPPTADSPYTVKRGFTYPVQKESGETEQRILRQESAWTRIGASNQDELRGDAQEILVSVSQVPWIDNAQWLGYADRPSPPEVDSYEWVELDAVLGDYGGGHPGDQVSAIELITQWLEDGSYTNLYIHGCIGAGKTTLLQKLDEQLRKRLMLASDVLLADDAPPAAWIPIVAPLHQESFGDQTSVTDYVLEQANITGHLAAIYDAETSTPEWRRKLLVSPGHRFLIILDGADEMEDDGGSWSRSMRSILRFSNTHRGRIRVIMSARTGTTRWPDVRTGWRELELAPFSRESVEFKVAKLDDAQVFWEALRATAGLEEYLRIPLVADRLIQYAKLVEKEMARSGRPLQYEAGRLVDQVVQAIMDHESRKDLLLRQQQERYERAQRLACLAWTLDGARDGAPLTEVQEILGSSDALYRAEQMGFLTGDSNGIWSFRTLIVKAYFAARYALNLAYKSQVNWHTELERITVGGTFWGIAADLLSSLVANDTLMQKLRPLLDGIGYSAMSHTGTNT